MAVSTFAYYQLGLAVIWLSTFGYYQLGLAVIWLLTFGYYQLGLAVMAVFKRTIRYDQLGCGKIQYSKAIRGCGGTEYKYRLIKGAAFSLMQVSLMKLTCIHCYIQVMIPEQAAALNTCVWVSGLQISKAILHHAHNDNRLFKCWQYWNFAPLFQWYRESDSQDGVGILCICQMISEISEYSLKFCTTPSVISVVWFTR